jgi:hypothetical protein
VGLFLSLGQLLFLVLSFLNVMSLLSRHLASHSSAVTCSCFILSGRSSFLGRQGWCGCFRLTSKVSGSLCRASIKNSKKSVLCAYFSALVSSYSFRATRNDFFFASFFFTRQRNPPVFCASLTGAPVECGAIRKRVGCKSKTNQRIGINSLMLHVCVCV